MGKRGQRIARKRDRLFENIHRKISPQNFLENKLIRLEKMDNDARLLWADFQNYLADEREKRLDEITDALLANTEHFIEGKNFSRIVGSKFSLSPLSSKGSYLMPPGGRFNIGQSISFQRYFPALYVANDYDTAFHEKFSIESDINEEISTSLRKPDSFTHHRINFKLDKIIDLTNDRAINAFYEVVKDIKMPKIYSDQAKRLKLKMNVVFSSSELKQTIFDPRYQQWDYWIDQPSPSQWFAHYVRYAGIQGIRYPSLRKMNGENVAIFLDTFEETDSVVELSDVSDFVPLTNIRVNSENFNLFI